MSRNTNNSKPESKRVSKKLSRETWLAIANLGLTAMIGIVMAIYLNVRNEDFQKYLFDAQNQSKYANIELTVFEPTIYGDTSLAGSIGIKNNGPATAKNVRIGICINHVNDLWTNEITDINQFDFYFTDQSLKIQTEYTSTCISSLDEKEENDGVVFIIDTLSPDQSSALIINIGKQIQRKAVHSSRQTQILIPRQIIPADSELPSYLHFKEPLSSYLTRAYYMISFSAQSSCENCTGDHGINGSIVTLFNWQWKNENALKKTDKYTETGVELFLSYMVPHDYYDETIDKPLYLFVDPDYYQIREMDKSNYETNQKIP